MRRFSLLCAAAGLGLAALAAASPAEAAFHLIRWQDTGFCQIWDEGSPIKPLASNYTRVSGSVPTLWAAIAAKDALWHKGKCKF